MEGAASLEAPHWIQLPLSYPPQKRTADVSLIHLQNELVQHRTFAKKSWSTYISFALDDATGEVVAETFKIFHDAQRPYDSSRKRVGQQRASYDQAPPAIAQQIQLFADILPATSRDTTAMPKRDTVSVSAYGR